MFRPSGRRIKLVGRMSAYGLEDVKMQLKRKSDERGYALRFKIHMSIDFQEGLFDTLGALSICCLIEFLSQAICALCAFSRFDTCATISHPSLTSYLFHRLFFGHASTDLFIKNLANNPSIEHLATDTYTSIFIHSLRILRSIHPSRKLRRIDPKLSGLIHLKRLALYLPPRSKSSRI